MIIQNLLIRDYKLLFSRVFSMREAIALDELVTRNPDRRSSSCYILGIINSARVPYTMFDKFDLIEQAIEA